jgi:hypothetical protein
VIEKYLRATEGFSGSICKNDVICYKCYKKQSDLLDTLQLFNLLPTTQATSAACTVDSELDSTIQSVMLQLQDLEQGTEEHAVFSTILMVATAIRKDNAILLPSAHKHFTSLLKQPPTSRERTCRWLLKELEKVLGHHMTSTCKHKKHGTVLSRTGGDLMNALSCALSVSSKSATNSELTSAATDRSRCTCSIDDKISEVGEFLNHKLHNLASTLIENDKKEPFDYQTLDIDKQMEMVDPALTQHILTLTQSYNEKRQLCTADEHSLSAHTKKVRRFYCLCVLLFCTNSRCCMPMHLLLTDVVKHHGGSSELIKVLNRVGAVSSEDTHGRLVTYISQQREKEMEAEFNPQAFKLASVDNIDVLSQYTKAYAGKTSNIWHGTSIQCVEPKPKSLLCTNKNTSTPHQVDPTSLAQQETDLTALAHQMGTASLPPTRQRDVTAHQVDPASLSHQVDPSSLAHQGDSTAPAHQMDTARLPVTHQGDLTHQMDPASLADQMDPAHEVDTASLPVTRQGDPASLTHQMDLASLAHQGDSTAPAHQMDTARLPVTHQGEVYFEAGLKDAAKTIGYTEGVLNSIGSCSKFKRTHLFLLRAWEAIFRVFLESFINENQTGSTISTQIKEVLKQAEGQTEIPNASALINLMLRICDDEGILKKEFMQYLSKLSALDKTCQLWVKFIIEDCLPYVGLFISIRSGNWNLRLASLKQMAALFTAYDRMTYQKLIPRHIAELLRAPPEVLSSLQKGGFAVSLTGMTTAFKNTYYYT